MEINQKKSAVLQGKRPWRTGEKVAKIQTVFLALRSGVVLHLLKMGMILENDLGPVAVKSLKNICNRNHVSLEKGCKHAGSQQSQGA